MPRRVAVQLALGLLLCVCAAPVHATVRTVTTTDDAGAGSLRAAIAAAGTGDTIEFAIPGSGVQTIAPQTALPPLPAAVTVDGTTQGGASCASVPYALTVEIDGGGTPPGTHGLTIAGDGVTVGGLVVNSFPGDGIHFETNANAATIRCNFIGTDASGSQDYGNGGAGIALAGSDGTAIDRNVISANAGPGVAIDAASSSVWLTRNWIGTDASGTAALGNFEGVVVSGAGNTIGGVALGNTISGNAESGIVLDGAGATANGVYDNQIGSNLAGDASLPNGGPGVFILGGAHHNAVGAVNGGGNLLRANGAAGVYLIGASSIGNAVRGNAMLLNGSIGIEIGDVFFENPNDPGDPDSGANRLQNTPELVDVAVAGDQVTAAFSVSTDPLNATYPLLIDFYLADADDEEGQSYLGSVVYDAADFGTGVVTEVFTALAPLPVPGDDVVATATDSDGNTSEFTAIAITVVPEPAAFACGLSSLAALALRRRRR